MNGIVKAARERFHERIMREIIRERSAKKYGKCQNFCDADSKKSVILGNGIVKRLPGAAGSSKIDGQKAGSLFEAAVKDFLRETFPYLETVRPGRWIFDPHKKTVDGFAQYAHLADLAHLIKTHPELADITGRDYIVKPDVIIARLPEPDGTINAKAPVVDDATARATPLREKNNAAPILHASVSCKWTMRSDRSQNSRTEALNLIRNRKGRLPHIVVVTMEPTPSRIASIAVGTGDIDCVYHAALYELLDAAKEGYETGKLDKDDHEWFTGLVASNRLRDISDLPLDLAI